MASKNAIIVTVLGDTSKLKASLNSATADINRFAGRSKIKSTAADSLLGNIRGMKLEADLLAKRAAEVDAQQAVMAQRFSTTAVKAGVAGLAVHILGTNLAEMGGNAGKAGKALQDLSSLNFVGFVKDIQGLGEADPGKIGADLLKYGDAAKSTKLANDFAAAGFDKLAAAARGATLEILAAQAAASVVTPSPGEGNLAGSNGGFRAFNGNPLPKGRRGITHDQRNLFFDNDITRALDRAQDGDLKDQVAKLRKVEATLKGRLAVTKDVTRQLRLEDEIRGVRRQQKGIEDTIAANAKQRAEAAARAAAELKKQQSARDEMLAQMRRQALQAKQFRALGFAADGSDVVPGADNLRKRLASIDDKVASGSVKLGSKLEHELEGARKLLAGKLGTMTRETRDRVDELFDTIAGNKSRAANGPLTATTQLSAERVLAGLSLGGVDERTLRARLSHFNSAGKALPGAGAGSRPVVVENHVTVELDGRKIAASASKYQKRKGRVNTARRNGPNAGVVVS